MKKTRKTYKTHMNSVISFKKQLDKILKDGPVAFDIKTNHYWTISKETIQKSIDI